MMVDLLKVMQREMLHSEHAAQCFTDAKHKRKPRIKTMTLEELLSMKVKSKMLFNEHVDIRPEFRIAVQEVNDEKGVRIIVHANGHNSETLDFWVKGNDISAL